MKRIGKLPASLWFVGGLVAALFCGGALSLGVQAMQSRQQSRAAAFDMTGGDARRGQAAISRAGCGACHDIPGVDRANGAVGPALDKIASRSFLAGRLANTPENMIQWIAHPQAIEPGSGMPNPPISDQEVRDIAAYLYTLD